MIQKVEKSSILVLVAMAMNTEKKRLTLQQAMEAILRKAHAPRAGHLIRVASLKVTMIRKVNSNIAIRKIAQATGKKDYFDSKGRVVKSETSNSIK